MRIVYKCPACGKPSIYFLGHEQHQDGSDFTRCREILEEQNQ